MMFKQIILLSLLAILEQNIFAQANTSMQDSTLNNLVHPDGYKTVRIGELGLIMKSGNGKQAMILVPGMGFGAEIFDDFVKQYKHAYTIYSITAAGFAGTPAPQMPDTSIKYSTMPWTYGITSGVLKLIEKEKLVNPIVVAHFITGTQVAFNLAINHPDRINKVIIISGSPYRYYGSPINGSQMNLDWEKEKKLTPVQRSVATETWIAPKWFKTVTKKTFDSFMWTPNDYCMDSIIGNQLFKSVAEVPLQVMIRYMVEWGAYDADEKYKDIKVPTLILIPDFKGILDCDPKDTISSKRVAAKLYLKYYHQQAWDKAKQSGNPLIQLLTIYDTRIFMWYDNPKGTYKAINKFLKQ